MKKLYFLVVLFVVGSVNAQNPDDIVYIQSPIFFGALIGSAESYSIARDIDGNYLKVDSNEDNQIQVSEAEQVYELQLNGSFINSAIGIQSFTNLEYLNCHSTNITTLDVSGLQNLKYLSCNSNNLNSLVILELPSLEELYCQGNNLSTLNLTGLSNLSTLSCSDNPLVSLEISMLENLAVLHCSYNQLSTLNLNGLINLKELDCSFNALMELDLSSQDDIEILICDNNPLSGLNVSGFGSLKELKLSNCPITVFNAQGLNSLESLTINSTEITSLDLSNLSTLKSLSCINGNISVLNLTGVDSIEYLGCSVNQLTSLDLLGKTKLKQVACFNNQLTTLDLSDQHELNFVSVKNNQLSSLFLKNNFQGSLSSIQIDNNPNLQYICSDENLVTQLQYKVTQLGYNCQVNSYCSFTPGGTFYAINGSNSFDTNNNGCDTSDISSPNLKFSITNGTQTGSLISNTSGEYSIPVQSGTHTITPVLESPTYFNVSPATASVTFPETTSPFTQNFCITPNGLHPDLEVAILPTTPARPGFDADYILIIKNKGNIPQSGSVSFAYDDTVLDYIIAEPVFTTQAEGSLSWAFADLQPFETREINVTLNVNSPMETPAVNGDDVLNYTATITSDQTDDLPLDNIFSLPQIVVNSFDPNDKTCLEGTVITPDMIGKYVHYMIRFENTGTFAAENIVVKDMIDTAKFDVSSLVALNGSHPYVTRITGNKVEFIFEGINLPFDDANNDGYVVFKIKTLPTLALGDSFSNTASIYFDFNHPIVTEPAVTTFAELGTKDFEFNSYLTLYPNPTNGILNITTKQTIELQSISIYNTLGQMVVSVPNAKGVNTVDVSSLSTGNYFIKIVSDKGTSNSKFIKQ